MWAGSSECGRDLANVGGIRHVWVGSSTCGQDPAVAILIPAHRQHALRSNETRPLSMRRCLCGSGRCGCVVPGAPAAVLPRGLTFQTVLKRLQAILQQRGPRRQHPRRIPRGISDRGISANRISDREILFGGGIRHRWIRHRGIRHRWIRHRWIRHRWIRHRGIRHRGIRHCGIRHCGIRHRGILRSIRHRGIHPGPSTRVRRLEHRRRQHAVKGPAVVKWP